MYLSPSGSLIADTPLDTNVALTTQIYKDGQLVSAVPYDAAGWIDDNRFLTHEFIGKPGGALYVTSRIYDASAMLLGQVTLAGPIRVDRAVDSNRVYSLDAAGGQIFNLTTGAVEWNPAPFVVCPSSQPPAGSVAANRVVYARCHQILAEAY
jgi:hypothetical protein